MSHTGHTWLHLAILPRTPTLAAYLTGNGPAVSGKLPGEPVKIALGHHHRQSRRSKNRSRTLLQDTCLIKPTRALHDVLRRRVAGQDHAIDALVCSYGRSLSLLRDTERPLLTALLLGPTGVGKTETARAVAEALLGSEKALVRVSCEEYAHSHQIAKLLGSPPGYVGHDIEPLLSQRNLDRAYFDQLEAGDEHRRAAWKDGAQTDENAGLYDARARKDAAVNDAGTQADRAPVRRSVILFDEIEKAHPAVWNALLGILDEGTLTLGDNSTTDFTDSIVLLTSNVGSHEMSRLLERRQLGFGNADASASPPQEELRQVVLAAARKTFPMEFLNRFDNMLVFRPLERRHLLAIFDKFLAEIHDRAVRQLGLPFLVQVSDGARDLIVDEGTDLRYGARPLRRTFERKLVEPLSRFIAAERLLPGDVVEVTRKGEELRFCRDRVEDVRGAA